MAPHNTSRLLQASIIVAQAPTRVVASWVQRVQHVESVMDYSALDLTQIDSNLVRCPDASAAEEMLTLIEEVRKEGSRERSPPFHLPPKH